MTLLLICFYVGAAAIIFAINWYKSRNDKVSRFFKQLPGPSGFPIIKNALELKSSENGLPLITKCIKIHGKKFKLEVGPISRFIVTDYKLLEYILNSTKLITKSDDYYYLSNWLGTGLLTSTGAKWKSHRKMLTPTFHFKILEDFIDIFDTNGDVMIKRLLQIEDKDNVDIVPFLGAYTLDVICESAMGVKVNAQTDETSRFVKAIKTMCRVLANRTISILKAFDFFYQMSQDYKDEMWAVKLLHDFTYSIIRKRQEELAKLSQNKVKVDEFGVKKRVAFLDLLLQTTCEGKPLTSEEIVEEVNTFIFEGHDTTATALGFAFYSLAENPEVQKKAHKEQMELFHGNPKPKVTYGDLQNMHYLEMVIKETLRLYPPVPVQGRKVEEDFEFEGLLIPKGINIFIPAFHIHRDPDLFPNPDQFHPERYENMNSNTPFAYIPFSAGPRNCIGQKFAILELKAAISKVLRNFEITPTVPEHKLRLCAEGILFSKNSVRVSLKPRL